MPATSFICWRAIQSLLCWRTGRLRSSTIAIAASLSPSASASRRLTAMRCRLGSGIRRETGLTVSRYSTMTRESYRCVPSSSTSTGILPSGLKACTGLSGVHGDTSEN